MSYSPKILPPSDCFEMNMPQANTHILPMHGSYNTVVPLYCTSATVVLPFPLSTKPCNFKLCFQQSVDL